MLGQVEFGASHTSSHNHSPDHTSPPHSRDNLVAAAMARSSITNSRDTTLSSVPVVGSRDTLSSIISSRELLGCHSGSGGGSATTTGGSGRLPSSVRFLESGMVVRSLESEDGTVQSSTRSRSSASTQVAGSVLSLAAGLAGGQLQGEMNVTGLTGAPGLTGVPAKAEGLLEAQVCDECEALQISLCVLTCRVLVCWAATHSSSASTTSSVILPHVRSVAALHSVPGCRRVLHVW